ncbi:MAG TPA: RodZ domain-containing protein [Marmoricola sp.]|nr:RodZ domain-containing protein [Marmoricola sp.]
MSSAISATGSIRTEPTAVVSIRRNVWLSGVVAGLAALIGVGYLWRGSNLLDTVVGVVLLLVALLHGSSLASARTPVLVADEHGIRLRVGLRWRGLPWSAVRQVVVEHADSPLREGRLVVVPRDPEALLEDVDLPGHLHLRWNELWYGAALSVPLGMTTLTHTRDLGAALDDLAEGRTDVVHLRGRQLAQLDDVVAPARDDHEGDEEQEPEDLPPVALEEDVEDEVIPVVDLPEPLPPVRPLNLPSRVEIRLDAPAIRRHDEESHAHAVPVQRQPDDLGGGVEPAPDLVHAEAWQELPVEVEADDLAVHGPDERTPLEPVIGPKIAHAREMLDMSIDELSQRTRIRPHVLEAIEEDDFGPCGGDFYARGHLTAIARVLGLGLEPLMKEYDDRYAGGPINARRVFEAELATGMSSGMRATRGGPKWTLLIGAVLCLTLVWGVARLLSGAPEEVAAPSVPSSDSAGLAANRQPITSPLMKTTTMTVTAAHAGAHVVVKDRTGRVLWSGALPMTHHRRVVGLAPFTVQADNAGAIDVTIAGQPMGTLGVAGKAGSKRFG